MISAEVTKTDILEALARIERDGVPTRRKARGYCLVANGRHFPPKYTIALAHEIATGEFLSSEAFSGGNECNDFLRRLGFDVAVCTCGGSIQARHPYNSACGPLYRASPEAASGRHSERCPECKVRVRQLLEQIYGICVPNKTFGWRTSLPHYAESSIGDTLRDVARALEMHRGFDIREFVRRDVLSGCDYWVPKPGFIVEFDESQHFTTPRKLALSVYTDDKHLGFSADRWIGLCEQHDAKDNDPPFRDQQRAWYDTLRDLVPSIKGLEPTVRLYARDRVWCSLDPDSKKDREYFSNLIHEPHPRSNRTAAPIRSLSVGLKPILRAAMVFPEVGHRAKNGVPPVGGGAQRPTMPTIASFLGEAVDFVLFPEGYIRACDDKRKRSLQILASELNAPLLVGAIDKNLDTSDRAWQVLLRFEPDGASPSQVYVKHSTADAVAFERRDWESRAALPTFDLGGVRAGATICHDHYLGLLLRFLAKQGARLWLNPSYHNVNDIKWSSVLRLRAVENRFFALCTLHRDLSARTRSHPFAFSPDGEELSARRVGSDLVRPLSECDEAGSIYIVELDMNAVGEALDWSKLPPAFPPKPARNGTLSKSVRIALRGGKPAVFGCSGWQTDDGDLCIETEHGPVYLGVVPEERILDAAACFDVLDRAKRLRCAPIIWNHWERLPADSAKVAALMMGRAIECCAPVVVSDQDGVCELVELSNRNKIPVRRTIDTSEAPTVDIRYAWGLKNAFKMVEGKVRRDMRLEALDRYRSLC